MKAYTTKTLMSDFRDLKTISYKDYLDIKGYTIFNLENINKNKIRKLSDKLFINNKVFKIDNISINSLIDILFKELPDLDIFFYEDHPESYLNSSAMFLADFNTEFTTKFYVTDEIISADLIKTYTDSEGNTYDLKDLIMFSEFNDELIYYKREDSYRVGVKNQRVTLVCSYEAKDLKVSYLQEFPISSLNQINSMNTKRSLDTWN